MFKLVILIFCLFIFPSSISAQVVINEFSPASNPNGYGDWIELYIYENIDLSNYYMTHLKADGNSEGNIDIPEPYEYGPSSSNGQFKIISVNNYLGNNGDRIRLIYKNNTSVIDDISYGDSGGVCVSSQNGSIGRVYQTDIEGSNIIDRFSNYTKGLSNKDNILDPCPSPTPEPTATSVPTSTPTKIPSPTKTPSPSPTNKLVSKTSTPAPVKEIATEDTEDVLDNTKEAVLGINEIGDSTGTPTPKSKIADEGKRSIPLSAGLFVILGLVFISFAFYQLLRSRKKGYNFGSVENTDKQE